MILLQETNVDTHQVKPEILDKVAFQVNSARQKLTQKMNLRKRQDQVMELIDNLFDSVAEEMLDNVTQRTELFQKLQDARILVINQSSEAEREIAIQQAEFEAKTVKAVIFRESQRRIQDKVLRWVVPIMIIAYVLLIAGTVVFSKNNVWTTTTSVPILGIPISVLLWAALGSLAAILYRFYSREFLRINEEIRWLIARPIIGIIMGCLSYLGIVSGLIIFGSTTPSLLEGDESRFYLFWIIAFLGGFSDQFFESIINLLSRKITMEEQDRNLP